MAADSAGDEGAPRGLGFQLWRISLLVLLPYLILGWATARIERDPIDRTIPPEIAIRASVADRAPADRTPADRAPGDTVQPAGSILPELPATARGVLSVHSERSHDAEGTVEEVAAAASDAGLDFVVLGDHATAWITEPGVFEPLRIEGVHLSRGAELVLEETGRTLTVGFDGIPRMWRGTFPELRSAVDSAGGFVSIVHPRSPRVRESWKVASVEGAHAFEAFDISEMARRRLASVWGPYHLISYLTGVVAGRSDETIVRLWRERSDTPALLAYDSLRSETRMSITGGLNHHPKMRTPFGLLPGYGPMFRTVVNHLHLARPLSADPAAAQDEIGAAIQEGRLYVSLGWPGESSGFVFAARAPEPRAPGAVLALGPETRLLAALPPGARGPLIVELRRDGTVVDRQIAGAGAVLRWNPARPGVYRVEVHRAGFALGPLRVGRAAWLFSNPIELVTP